MLVFNPDRVRDLCTCIFSRFSTRYRLKISFTFDSWPGSNRMRLYHMQSGRRLQVSSPSLAAKARLLSFHPTVTSNTERQANQAKSSESLKHLIKRCVPSPLFLQVSDSKSLVEAESSRTFFSFDTHYPSAGNNPRVSASASSSQQSAITCSCKPHSLNRVLDERLRTLEPTKTYLCIPAIEVAG